MTGTRRLDQGGNGSSGRTDILASAPPEILELLSIAGDLADRRREHVWVVGGLVRDLFLKRESVDIDLVILGRSREFAEDLAQQVGGRVRHHPAFLTADFISRRGFEVDVVRARSERYECRAVLPTVRSGSLAEDLFRRDFSINAMAVPLNGSSEELVDPFDGLVDLRQKRLRILHSRSFLDDPTRLLRALRLGQRLDFTMATETRRRAEEVVASGVFDDLSSSRLSTEILRLLASPEDVLELLPLIAELDLERVIHPGLSLPVKLPSYLEELASSVPTQSGESGRSLTVLCLLCWDLGAVERRELCDRLNLTGDQHYLVETVVPLVHEFLPALETLDSGHERFRAADSLGPQGRELARYTGGPTISAFFDQEWRDLEQCRLGISGEDLLREGLAAGPEIGLALRATLDARLDGTITEAEELPFALRRFSQLSGAVDHDDSPAHSPGDSSNESAD